jgi:hypothetical protein
VIYHEAAPAEIFSKPAEAFFQAHGRKIQTFFFGESGLFNDLWLSSFEKAILSVSLAGSQTRSGCPRRPATWPKRRPHRRCLRSGSHNVSTIARPSEYHKQLLRLAPRLPVFRTAGFPVRPAVCRE